MGQESGTRWELIVGIGLTVLFGVAGVIAVANAGQQLTIAGVLALGAIALTVNAIFFTTNRDNKEESPKPSPPIVAPVSAKLPSLEETEDAALLAASGYAPSEYPHRWEKHQPDADAPFEETAVIIYDEHGDWQTSASVFVVLKDCAWVPGSAKYLKNRNMTDCRLETVLAFPEFQTRLSSASHLIFVGMESYFDAPKPAASDDCDHKWLTACRADRLATRTYNEYFRDPAKPRPGLWELDIGYANSKSSALEWDQRRAVILGIRNRRPGLKVEDVVTKVITGAKVGVIRLADYSNAASAQAEEIPYSAWQTGGPSDTHH